MPLQFEISTIINAPANKLYDAWLDSTLHAAMTGGAAEVSAEVGGEFTAWDGYISGRNLELSPGKHILQAWRTVEFDESEPDSTLEIHFEQRGEQTKVTIRHSNLPPHGMQYEQGWVDNYFEPMKLYFSS
jgi:activator of HSP90 ATPase